MKGKINTGYYRAKEIIGLSEVKAGRTFRACLALFRIRAAEALQYRMAALSAASIGLFWVFIEIAVYTVFYKYADNKDAATALSYPQMVSYIWVSQISMGLRFPDMDGEILGKIVKGDIGIELCRPLDLYFHWFAKSAAGRLGGFWWRAVITAVAGLLIPPPYRLSGASSIAGLVVFLITTAAGFLLSLSYGMLLTSVRLGITWGDGPTYMLGLAGGVLSGAYLPLQLWPDFLQKFLFLQPFAGQDDLPLRFYVGSMPPSGAFAALGVQLGWTAVFVLAGRLIMRRKIRNIIVQGG